MKVCHSASSWFAMRTVRLSCFKRTVISYCCDHDETKWKASGVQQRVEPSHMARLLVNSSLASRDRVITVGLCFQVQVPVSFTNPILYVQYKFVRCFWKAEPFELCVVTANSCVDSATIRQKTLVPLGPRLIIQVTSRHLSVQVVFFSAMTLSCRCYDPCRR